MKNFKLLLVLFVGITFISQIKAVKLFNGTSDYIKFIITKNANLSEHEKKNGTAEKSIVLKSFDSGHLNVPSLNDADYEIAIHGPY